AGAIVEPPGEGRRGEGYSPAGGGGRPGPGDGIDHVLTRELAAVEVAHLPFAEGDGVRRPIGDVADADGGAIDTVDAVGVATRPIEGRPDRGEIVVAGPAALARGEARAGGEGVILTGGEMGRGAEEAFDPGVVRRPVGRGPGAVVLGDNREIAGVVKRDLL